MINLYVAGTFLDLSMQETNCKKRSSSRQKINLWKPNPNIGYDNIDSHNNVYHNNSYPYIGYHNTGSHIIGYDNIG